ncbi:DUF7344 domain-containing protein [Natronomonas aquatica]|uniref:DUF7344 domain-containing protein n=1 Tax=Natronomonas aquatica TaxID=2841590 RepID=UPI003AF07085
MWLLITMIEESSSPDGLSDIYHALRATRRRYVIQWFAAHNEETASVRELAKWIAATENDLESDHATGEDYRNVYNALSQSHLPTLSDAGLVIYDSDRQSVAPGPDFQAGVLLVILNRVAYYTIKTEELFDGSVPSF